MTDDTTSEQKNVDGVASMEPAAVEVTVNTPPAPVVGTEPETVTPETVTPAPAPQWGQGQYAPPGPEQLLAPAPAFIDPEQAARKARRKRNTLRWSGAVALTAVVGGAMALWVASPRRADLPGLGTPSDGRYIFPALTLPTLPAGMAAPGDPGNAGEQHLADIRKLLLPLPQGATADGSLPGRSGWVSLADTAALSGDDQTKTSLSALGLRHTAAEAWKTSSDGTTTKIYLLQFIDSSQAQTADATFPLKLTGVPQNSTVLTTDLLGKENASYSVVNAGGKVSRYGTFYVHDTLVLVVQSGPASLPLTPFVQVLSLQYELLQ